MFHGKLWELVTILGLQPDLEIGWRHQIQTCISSPQNSSRLFGTGLLYFCLAFMLLVEDIWRGRTEWEEGRETRVGWIFKIVWKQKDFAVFPKSGLGVFSLFGPISGKEEDSCTLWAGCWSDRSVKPTGKSCDAGPTEEGSPPTCPLALLVSDLQCQQTFEVYCSV